MAQRLNDAILRAASTAIPKKAPPNRPKPLWWSRELFARRKELRSAMRNRSHERENVQLNISYRAARNAFTAQLRTDKRKSWRVFCTSKGLKPWGRLYQWLRKGPLPHKLPISLKKPNGNFCISLEESATVALDSLIPNDPLNVHIEISDQRTFLFVPCDAIELKESLWKINPSKAPGKDNLTAAIIRRAWPLIEDIFLNITNECLKTANFLTSGKEPKLS